MSAKYISINSAISLLGIKRKEMYAFLHLDSVKECYLLCSRQVNGIYFVLANSSNWEQLKYIPAVNNIIYAIAIQWNSAWQWLWVKYCHKIIEYMMYRVWRTRRFEKKSESVSHSVLLSSCRWELLRHVRLFVTSWTIYFMEFSRPEYWNG